MDLYYGVKLVDLSQDKAEFPTIWEVLIHNHSIRLKSLSWRKQNVSKIMIGGIDYSANQRGANIAIVDSETFEILDSVSYDTHKMQDCFKRKNNI